ncbi:MAG TPA: efflux RND transporter permease subunit, partial [Bacteroidales bacterium]
IVDGAVIIVESVIYTITHHHKQVIKVQDMTELETITQQSSSKLMRSAVFGQLIILIVYFPILSLQGIEGKMFKPMAMTVGFAIIGAMLLCLTYVPMISSVFLRVKVNNHPQRGWL